MSEIKTQQQQAPIQILPTTSASTPGGPSPIIISMSSTGPGSSGQTPLATGGPLKPVPMKFFSSWEVDRTPSNCIPRLCVLTLTHLTIQRPLVPTPETTHSVFIAVKMVGSRRTIRSNEISLGPMGLIDTDLELHFSLQYPHFLKREENKLLIMLQRRKKYKNRTILGYRTLAEGTIDMALVLQRTSNLILQLLPTESSGNNKEILANVPVASVYVHGLSSQPVDELDDRKGKASRRLRTRPSSEVNPTPTSILLPGTKSSRGGAGATLVQQGVDFSDDEDEFSSQSSDSPPDDGANGNGTGPRKSVIKVPTAVGNRNLKQKIVSLLRKFKQSEDLVGLDDGTTGSGKKLPGHHHHHRPTHHHSESLAIEELFDELECLSDSEPDADTLSVGSMPRPVLPPFFSSSKNLDKELHYAPQPPDSDSYTEPEPESPKFSRIIPTGTSISTTMYNPPISSYVSTTPVHVETTLASQVIVSTPQSASADESITGFPSLVIFVSNSLDQSNQITAVLKSRSIKQVIPVDNETEVKTQLASIVNRIQKFCNTNSKTPPPVTVVAIGNEHLLSWIAKSYVNQLSTKPHDWQGYFAFIFVPLQQMQGSSGPVHKLLCGQDTKYAQFFNDLRSDGNDTEELVHHLISYVNRCSGGITSSQSNNGNISASNTRHIVYLPIAEAMITYKEENEESSQVFVPFITDVRLNVGYSLLSVDQGQSCEANEPPALSSSPPSPHTIGQGPGTSPATPLSFQREDPLELQIDYWKGTVKSSIKAHFRSLNIQRTVDNLLSLSYVLKEQKKQKIMRLGKKKDRESETAKSNQCCLEGISRLVCLSKSQTPIKLHVDGTEWPGVKFFQISSQWPSGVKALPLLISRGSPGELRGLGDF